MNLYPIFPEIILTSAGGITLFLKLVTKKSKISAIVSLAGLFLAIYFTLSMSDSNYSLFNGSYSSDSFSIFFKIIFLISSVLVVIGAIEFWKNSPHESEYNALVLFATVGMMIIASAREFITLFIGIELANICAFILTAYAKTEKRSSEAAIKYFLASTISSAIFLYGVSVVYGLTGSTFYNDISKISNSSAGLLALALLIAGISYKIAAVPFHMWAPDTYEGATSDISAFLSGALKKSGFAVLFPLLFIALIQFKLEWTLLFSILSVVAMTLGNIFAISQRNIKRMLAYSSIAQGGYIMMAFAVATPEAIMSGMFHIIAHSVMTIGAFLIAGILGLLMIGDNIGDYAGLWKRSPVIAISMAALLLSLIGIPPLMGFWGKFLLFLSAIRANMAWLAVIGILNSVISVYYYINVVRVMFFLEPKDDERIHIPLTASIAVLSALLLVIFFGIFPDIFLSMGMKAAGVLL